MVLMASETAFFEINLSVRKGVRAGFPKVFAKCSQSVCQDFEKCSPPDFKICATTFPNPHSRKW